MCDKTRNKNIFVSISDVRFSAWNFNKNEKLFEMMEIFVATKENSTLLRQSIRIARELVFY